MLPVSGEPERSCDARVEHPSGQRLLVFASVLPWRGDLLQDPLRGAAAFCASLSAQLKDISALREEYPGERICLLGDLNQELDGPCRVGTARGREMLDSSLKERDMVCLAAGERDPLLQRGWPASIDHVITCCALAEHRSNAEVWPDRYPLPAGWPDHYGVAVQFNPKEVVICGYV